MIEAFVASFSGTLSAMTAIFLIIVGAGLLVRRGVMTQGHISGLSAATVNVFLPCLIFSKVFENLDPDGLPGWWALPLAGVFMALIGTGLGALAFLDRLPSRRDLLPLAGMQNAGYLVLPIGLALFPNRFDEFALYVFLFILGYNPVLWSLGKVLVTGNNGVRPRLRDLFTPPLVANLIAIVIVLTGLGGYVPRPAVAALELLGSAAVPVATFVLGAVLGSIGIRLRHHIWDAARAMMVKLLILPALTIGVILAFNLHESNALLAQFFVIEAAAAPAVAIVLQVRTYGGDESRVGTTMVLSYIACIFTLPAWVAVWSLITKS